MLHVILVGTEDPGNIGAIARLMANFGVSNLLLIDPSANALDIEAIRRAKHAKEILEKAPLVTKEVLSQFDLLIGTSGVRGTETNFKRLPISARACAEKIASLEGKHHVGLVFGSESKGLSNEILAACDLTVGIPTKEEYPSMNLSHAVAIVLYECHLATRKNTPLPSLEAKQKQAFLYLIESCAKKSGYLETQNLLVAMKHLLATSQITEKELNSMFGFLRSIEENLTKK